MMLYNLYAGMYPYSRGINSYYALEWLLFLLPVIFCLGAQALVNSRYKRYSRIINSRGLTGAQAAQMILQSRGITNVAIQPVSGRLTDNYNPKTNIISLSEGVYNSTSIAAIGIACHEAGHACQYAEGYSPIKLRNAVIPIANIGSKIGLPICLIGLILSYFASQFAMIAYIGLALYGLVLLFQLITLPVEFNASSRALEGIKAINLLSANEYSGAKKVLSAAALTYVAAMASTLATILRILLIVNGRRR